MSGAPVEFSEVWYTRCQVPTASGIALDLGWLERRYLSDDAAFGVLQDAPLEIALAHYDHSLPTLIREGGNVPAIVAKAGGAPTRLIGLTWIDEGQAIVGHPEKVRSAADLQGARITVPAFADRRTASHARAMAIGGFEAALAAHGLKLDDTVIIDIPLAATVPPGKLRKALGIKDWPALQLVADGQADAAYVKGAAAREAAKDLGLAVVVDIDALPKAARVNNGTPRPLTAHADLIEQRPEWVIDFLALTLNAAAWAADHPQATIDLVSRETGGSSAAVTALYGSGFHRGLAPDLSDERLGLLDIQIDRLARHGFIERTFSAHDWADHALLEAAHARRQELARIYQPSSSDPSRLQRADKSERYASSVRFG
jgi:ABC-type nitrate/sulfonate/bicarbonate transport system substrate-binding protein